MVGTGELTTALTGARTLLISGVVTGAVAVVVGVIGATGAVAAFAAKAAAA